MSMESLISSFVSDLREMSAEAHAVTFDELGNIADEAGLPNCIPLAIRHGKTPEIINLKPLFESWRDRPAAKRGTATALTLKSFVDLTNRHKTPHSTIFANTDWRQPSLLAVIDYHEKGATLVEGEVGPISGTADPENPPLVEGAIGTYAPRPDNLKHRIAYAYPLSDTWKEWIKQNGEMMTQGDFAAWIEDHISDLSSPEDAEKIWLERDFQTTVATPSALIQISRGLQINVEAKVKNVVTLQSGAAQIAFEETHLGGDGKPLTIPGLFLLQVAPFFGGDVVRVPVRLRYRVMGGVTKWFFSMHRPDIHITQRLKDDLFYVARDTALPVYEGTPEA